MGLCNGKTARELSTEKKITVPIKISSIINDKLYLKELNKIISDLKKENATLLF